MKKGDYIFLLMVLAIVCGFMFIPQLGMAFKANTLAHPYIMAFLKFAFLATLGELLGLRIKSGVYNYHGFGVMPRAIVWGILGVGIAAAMKIFSVGAPALVESFGVDGVVEAMKGGFSLNKLLGAFAISFTMNTIFAPIFMTFHKITDAHIISCGGSLKAFITPLHFGEALKNLNWGVQWNFVFKKTIPLFWYLAHTITFILPSEYQVLFAAFLGVALGLILSVANLKSK